MSRNVRVDYITQTTLDYITQIRPCNHNRSFPQKSNGTQYSKFYYKRIPSNGEAAGHPCLLFLAWKNRIFCYYCKLFRSGYPLAQYSIPLLSAGTTFVTPFWSGRCLAREEVIMRIVIIWFLGCNGAVHWSLCWRGLSITFTVLAFVTSPISIITPRSPSKFSTHHWVGPRKSVSNQAQHLLIPALQTRLPDLPPKHSFILISLNYEIKPTLTFRMIYKKLQFLQFVVQ